jgi:hypothetical protein
MATGRRKRRPAEAIEPSSNWNRAMKWLLWGILLLAGVATLAGC